MSIFEEIQVLLAQENPFVCYVKPNENVWNLLMQQTDDVIEFSGQSGFVFVPFNDGVSVVIPFENNTFLQGEIDTIDKKIIQE